MLAAHQIAVKNKKIDTAEYQRIRKRCQMAVLNVCEIPRQAIAWFSDCHPSVVSRWISRALDGEELCDRARSGRPSFFSEDMQLKTIAHCCQRTPAPGCNRWSLRWAETFLNHDTTLIGRTISRSTIQRILANHSLRPHLNKYFLAITDPDFFPKMDHIINLYTNRPEYLFCYDECTGMQAKSRLAPDLPFETNNPNKEEFEYMRHGTTDLLAFLNVKNGNVFGRCALNHTAKTFSNIFWEHVNTLPANATLHYIMDNLNTHFNDTFCQTVADLCNVNYTPLKTGALRRHWLQNEDKRIVIHFTPFHGSWLNMVEIWFGILNQRCLRHQHFSSVSAMQETILAFIETWNQCFAHPFKWTYTGKGLQEKAIARLNKLLMIESHQMGAKFFTKQLLLMKNIVSVDPNKTKTVEWRKLCKLIPEKFKYIDAIISDAPKERQREEANQALQQLYAILN